jgi:glycerophosphoryl diester phosphodiesterase
MTYAYLSHPKPRFLGHRGAAGLAPENTLVSFQTSAAFTRYIETDTWISKDGVAVFHHDESVLRTCGVDRKISELTFSEIQELDAGATFSLDGGKSFPFKGKGHRIPSLEEAMQALPQHCFNIEIKDPHPKAVAQVLKAIEKAQGIDRTLLAAERDEIMLRIRKEKPAAIPTSASYGEVLGFIHWLMSGAKAGAYHCEAQAFQIPYEWNGQDLGKPEIIAALHGMNIEVHYWTVNERHIIERLLKAGADGIVTDFPSFAQDF